MKRTLNNILVLGICSAMALTACVDRISVGEDSLDRNPSEAYEDDSLAFTKPEYARKLLWTAYDDMNYALVSKHVEAGWPADALSDSYQCYFPAGEVVQFWYPGTLTAGTFDARTADFLKGLYSTSRKCWLIVRKIDNVPDMAESEKSRLRGEAYTIMAARYFDAFSRFGGLCLVKKAYTKGEKFTGGRATAWETVNFIDSLLQNAIGEPGFIWNVDNADLGQWSWRLTRASAKALRAKLWMTAASPLFNNDQPYMQYDPEATGPGSSIEHVWFGKKDPTLWNRCLEACNDFFNDNESNGRFYQLVMPQTDDEAGYRMAYRKAYRYPNDVSRHEKIFDLKPVQYLSQLDLGACRRGSAAPTAELMQEFGMADGTNYPFAEADIYGPGRNQSGRDIFADRDPRLYETIAVPRQDIPVETVGDYNGLTYIDSWVDGGAETFDGGFSGLGRFKWVLDGSKAKMDDRPISVAFIRIAEIHLIMAEALAEAGDLAGSLKNINEVRRRVGLGGLETQNPQLNLTSNKENLINEILRERNCELGAESSVRHFDMARRMRQDLFCKPLHELWIYRLDESGNRLTGGDRSWVPGTPWPKFEYERPDITTFNRRWWEPGFWTNKWYLQPLPESEINKGYGLTQNPGW